MLALPKGNHKLDFGGKGLPVLLALGVSVGLHGLVAAFFSMAPAPVFPALQEPHGEMRVTVRTRQSSAFPSKGSSREAHAVSGKPRREVAVSSAPVMALQESSPEPDVGLAELPKGGTASSAVESVASPTPAGSGADTSAETLSPVSPLVLGFRLAVPQKFLGLGLFPRVYDLFFVPADRGFRLQRVVSQGRPHRPLDGALQTQLGEVLSPLPRPLQDLLEKKSRGSGGSEVRVTVTLTEGD